MISEARTRWYSNPENSAYLSKVLEDQVLKEAIAVLIEEGQPEQVSHEGPSADVLTRNALEHQRLVGYQQFLSGLRSLAGPQQRAPEMPQQYGEDQMRDYCKAQGIPFPGDKFSQEQDQPAP